MKQRKHGTTLMELCIVMALVAIAVSMTVTFTILSSQRVTLSQKQSDAMEDVATLETSLKRWILHYDNEEYTIDADESSREGTEGDFGKLVATSTKDKSKSYAFYFDAEAGEVVSEMFTVTKEGAAKKDIQRKKAQGVEKALFRIDRKKNLSGGLDTKDRRMLIRCSAVYKQMISSDKTERRNFDFLFATHSLAQFGRVID